MKLSEYLAQEKLTQAQFAELVGAHPITVNKWATGSAIPRRAQMDGIARATAGAVSPVDFYGPRLPAPRQPHEAV